MLSKKKGIDKMEYYIISGEYVNNITKIINEMWQDGWDVDGELVTANGYRIFLYQRMKRLKKEGRQTRQV